MKSTKKLTKLQMEQLKTELSSSVSSSQNQRKHEERLY